ncbi:hypothetical protein AVEN_48092-1, partial [Araneus ventricosus]
MPLIKTIRVRRRSDLANSNHKRYNVIAVIPMKWLFPGSFKKLFCSKYGCKARARDLEPPVNCRSSATQLWENVLLGHIG